MKPRHPHRQFWNREYQGPTHLALSTGPAEDLLKFIRWLSRRSGGSVLSWFRNATVLDLGCGNGRNLIYLAREFGCRGVGYDSSAAAIKQAAAASSDLRRSASGNAKLEQAPTLLRFAVRSISEPLPLPDASVTLVLDMMTSQVLRAGEREALRNEIVRVLKPGGWLFFKSFLLEEDRHAKRLLRDYPSDEPHAYLHPEFGLAEHVWTTAEIESFFGGDFIVRKINKSHKHLARGRAFRRRTVSVYLEKKE